MKIGEIYRLKEDFKINNIDNIEDIDDKVKLALLPNNIRISYFSTNVDNDEFFIIAETFVDETMFYSAPSDYKHFKDKEEILKYYEHYMTAEEFEKYLHDNWYNNNVLEEIKDNYNCFIDFLNSIDLEKLKEKYDRKTLEKFANDLYKLEIPDIPYQIWKLTEEKKKEEYPKLLGVHHYPELKEINFLTEENKIKLDDYLGNLGVGKYILNLYRFVGQNKNFSKLTKFLLDKGIIEERFLLRCPECDETEISKVLTKEELNEVKEVIENNNAEKLEEMNYKNIIFFSCMNCEEEINWDNFNENWISTNYILVKERDKSLDNI